MPIVNLSSEEEKLLRENPYSKEGRALSESKKLCTRRQLFKVIKNGEIDQVNYPRFYLQSAYIYIRPSRHHWYIKDDCYTPLQAAIAGNYETIVKLLLEQGADIEVQDKNGRTSLHYAVMRNKTIAIAELLIKKGANIKAKDNNGRTPLHLAASLEGASGWCWQETQNNHRRAAEVIKLLLKHGANINAKDNDNWTPLRMAAYGCMTAYSFDIIVIKLLLEQGAAIENDYGLLHWVAAKGEEALLKQLVEKGGDINAKDDNGLTPLHHAAMKGKEAIAELLIEKGVNIKAKDNNGRTPLHCAAIAWQEPVVKLLLEHKADKESKDNDGQTPLYAAILNDNVKEVAALNLLFGCEVNTEAKDIHALLHWTAHSGRIEVIKLLLELGADKKINKIISGYTLLHLAAARGHEAIVKLLLELGAMIETKDNNGRTPLYAAAANGREAIVKLLLEKGANLKDKDNNGRTPLYAAAANGHEVVVEQLFKAGADLKAKDNNDWTVFRAAIANNHKEVIKLLLETGAVVLDDKDKSGWTLLHWAAAKGNEMILEWLLEKGAEVDAQNFAGKTPLHYAAANGHKSTIELLLKHKTKIDALDKNDATPSHWAAAKGHQAVLMLLLEKGANIEATNNTGKTPLHCAAANGHVAVVKLLLEQGAKAAKDIDGHMPWHLAAMNGQHGVINFLVDQYKVDLREKDNNNQNTLLLATANEHLQTVKFLLVHDKVLIGSADQNGDTALHVAVARGHLKIAKLLLREEPELLEMVNYVGETSLQIAARQGYNPCIEFLLSQQANLEARDREGRTALLLAAGAGKVETVKLLIERKAWLTAKDSKGWNVLHHAVAHEKKEIVQAILDIPGFNYGSLTKAGEIAEQLTRNYEILKIISQHRFNPPKSEEHKLIKGHKWQLLEKFYLSEREDFFKQTGKNKKWHSLLLMPAEIEIVAKNIGKNTIVLKKEHDKINAYRIDNGRISQPIPLELTKNEENMLKFPEAGQKSLAITIDKNQGIVEKITTLCGRDFNYISGLIGGGNFGQVGLARNTQTGEFVVFKKIARNISASKDEAPLQRELEGQPNLVTLLDSHEIKSNAGKTTELFHILPYFINGTGKKLKKNLKVLNDPELSVINPLQKMRYLVNSAKGLLTALNCMHQLGIYHLDIKLDNILFNEDGDAILADYGASVKSDTIDLPEKYRDRGHRAHYSLERVLCANGKTKSFDAAKADSWALGLTLLELAGYSLKVDYSHMKDWPESYLQEKISFIYESKYDDNEFFQLLRGLLDYNPQKRLTPMQALQLPLFKKSEYNYSSSTQVSSTFSFGYVKALAKKTKIAERQITKIEVDLQKVLEEEEEKAASDDNAIEDSPYLEKITEEQETDATNDEIPSQSMSNPSNRTAKSNIQVKLLGESLTKVFSNTTENQSADVLNGRNTETIQPH